MQGRSAFFKSRDPLVVIFKFRFDFIEALDDLVQAAVHVSTQVVNSLVKGFEVSALIERCQADSDDDRQRDLNERGVQDGWDVHVGYLSLPRTWKGMEEHA